MSTYDMVIGKADRATLVERAHRCPFDPYAAFDEFLQEAADAFGALSSPVRAGFSEFVAGSTSAGALLIEGLPEDPSLPPTPTHDDGGRYTTSVVTEFAMCAIASAVGEPVGYAPERWGQLVHNVFPTQGEAIPSQRFRTGLGFHSELVCHPDAPAHVLLLCLRQDPEAEAITWVLDVRTLLHNLPESVRAALFRPEFALDLGKLHYVYTSKGVRISNRPENRPLIGVLSGGPADPSIRYEPALMTPQTDEAQRAFDHVGEVIADLATPVVLRPGSAVLIDNRRALHARSSFRARFDGSDRWLRRMMIAAGPRPRSPEGVERVIDIDLLVGWSHRPTVASVGAP